MFTATIHLQPLYVYSHYMFTATIRLQPLYVYSHTDALFCLSRTAITPTMFIHAHPYPF
jgi:hypothetical protein